MFVQDIIDDLIIILNGEWKNNLTFVEFRLQYFNAFVLPYEKIIVAVFASLGIIITPLAGYINYVATPKNLTEYKYYAIYNRISLLLFALINLLWQPVCISPFFIIYSQGMLKDCGSTIQFIMLWLFLSCALCSVHAIGSDLIFLCKLSLLPCNSWHGDPKKYKILMGFFATVIIFSILMIWFTFPDSTDSLQNYHKVYPFLNKFLPPDHSILAFNIFNYPMCFKIFVIYLISIIAICLIVFPYQCFDYYMTVWKQQKLLSRRTQKDTASVRISIQIRLVFVIAFIQGPFICCCFCLYFGLFPIYFSFCVCLFSMFPFFDAFTEIFIIKFYRQKAISILCCAYFKKRKISHQHFQSWGNNDRRFS